MNLSMNDRKKAVLLTTALLVIAVLCVVRIYVVSHSSVENGQALYADLYQNGELLQTIRLDTVTAEYTFEVSGNAGATNTVCVRPGSIAIVSASCPDHVESALPPIVPIPGIKLGLSNIITLVVLWKYSAKDAFFVLLVRILLATMFFGQAMSLLYSLSGGILCLFAMLLVKLLLHGNYLFLASMTGAVFHNLGQIGVAFLLTSVPAVLVYLPFLLLSGLVTGLFIGLCARFTLRFLP